MTGRLGLTPEAAQLLDDLRDWGSWAFVRDLCSGRDGAVVLRCLAELRRAGLVTVSGGRAGTRGRQRVELTPAGEAGR